MKLIGLLLLIAVLVVGWRLFTNVASPPVVPTVAQTVPEPEPVVEQPVIIPTVDVDRLIDEAVAKAAAEIEAQSAANQPELQVAAPESVAVAPEPEPAAVAPTGGCRVVADGYLETSSIIGASDAQFVHGVYWFQGEPEYNVLLDGSRWQRPSGAGGRFWAYGGGGCTRDFVAAQIAGHIERTTAEGVNTGGMGDPSLFTRVS